jgi:hypothetical protein
MSATSAPFGFIPTVNQKGLSAARPYKIAAAYATAIYKYQPVKLVTAGTIEAGAAAEDLLGTLAGVEYTDAEGRRVVNTKWPTGGVSGATDIVAWVWDDPENEFVVQANGSVAQAAIGDQADVVNATDNGNGMSQAMLNATLAGAGLQGQFRIVDFEKSVDNAPGDAFTKVIVKIARHQYVGNKVAI